MHILYYITSHGYGHAVRSAAVCNWLGGLRDDVRLTVVSDVPVRFFEEELTLPHSVRKGGFDIGCLQSDGVTVLVEETLRAYEEICARNELLVGGEARWCIENGVDCVVSDITPFAFEIAERAGVPSVAVGNFTWHDIYLPYAGRFPQYEPMLSAMADQYGKATAALALYPASDMAVFGGRKKIVPIVGKKGRSRRVKIFDTFGISPNKRLGLIYVGNFGLDNIPWSKLEGFDGWEFVGVYPLPGNPKNYHTVTKDRFRYEDLSASADAIIAKMGYGVFSESLLNGVPLVYLPREDFSEFAVLDAETKRLGAGICIDASAFAGLEWQGVLDCLVNNNKMEPAENTGARVCAEEILRYVG